MKSQNLMFISLVLGLILGTFAMILAPVLSSKTLHLTLVPSSGIPTPFSLSLSTKFMIGIVAHILCLMLLIMLCDPKCCFGLELWCPCERAYCKRHNVSCSSFCNFFVKLCHILSKLPQISAFHHSFIDIAFGCRVMPMILVIFEFYQFWVLHACWLTCTLIH